MACLPSTASYWAVSGNAYCAQLGLVCTGVAYYGSSPSCSGIEYTGCWGSSPSSCCSYGMAGHAGTYAGASARWACVAGNSVPPPSPPSPPPPPPAMRVVDFALRLAGDVSSFTLSVRTEIKSAIAARAGVNASAVMVTVTSGSVIVDVRIQTPTAMATSVQSAMASATSSLSSTTAMLASVTGVSITVLAVVTPPIVANVQPSPPPPPPQRPPDALNSADGGAITILAIAVPAALLALLCCLAMVCWWTRRRQVELRRKDVNNWLHSMSVSTVSADELHEQQPHAGGSVAVAEASIPSGRGGGGSGSGVEMSVRFDRRTSRTEDRSRVDDPKGGARPAMAGVIGTSGSNTIRKPTLTERSRMQQEETQQVAAMSARGGSTIVHEQQWGCSSASSAPDLSVVNDSRRDRSFRTCR